MATPKNPKAKARTLNFGSASVQRQPVTIRRFSWQGPAPAPLVEKDAQ